MLRSIVLILVFTLVAYSTAEVPSISDTDSPPALRNFPDRPEKRDPPTIADRSYSPPASPAGSPTVPRQEFPGDDSLELQTSDACDSADTVRLTVLSSTGEKR